MVYTLRQVQTLLNATELDLFSASRRDAIGAFSAKQLLSKITRARTLRDKYRDLYQRQTVQTQRLAPHNRKHDGGENQRTQRKADVLADILARFETQAEKVAAATAKNVPSKPKRHNAPGVATQKTNPKRAQTSRRHSPQSADSVSPKADMPMRGKTQRKKADLQADTQKARDAGKATVKARGAASTRKAAPSTARAATGKAQTAAKKSAGKSITALAKGVKKALAKKLPQAAVENTPGKRRGLRNAISGTASASARGAVPTDMPARAKRVDVLREAPLNLKIHNSAQGRNANFQARRDAR